MTPLLHHLAATHSLTVREIPGHGWCCQIGAGRALTTLGHDAGRAVVRLLSIAACVSPRVGVA